MAFYHIISGPYGWGWVSISEVEATTGLSLEELLVRYPDDRRVPAFLPDTGEVIDDVWDIVDDHVQVGGEARIPAGCGIMFRNLRQAWVRELVVEDGFFTRYVLENGAEVYRPFLEKEGHDMSFCPA